MSTYHRRVRSGVCVTCGVKPAGHTKKCEECRVSTNATQGKRQKEAREFWKDTDWCEDCGSAKRIKGQTRCVGCRDKARERNRRYRARILLIGRCSCGQPINKYTHHCDGCGKKIAERMRKRYDTMRKM